jgi:hypothetical protein
MDYRGENGMVVSCSCSSSATSSGSVWGNDYYTDNSSPCRAALHAGLISPSGGSFNAVIAAGAYSYNSTTRNGVTSDNWGSWPGSYYFLPPDCPSDMMEYRGPTVTEVTCYCSSAASRYNGLVWGTSYYTDDSHLCTAAVHAGRITTKGGTITSIPTDGRDSYTGSTRNGVMTYNRGSWPASYYFY